MIGDIRKIYKKRRFFYLISQPVTIVICESDKRNKEKVDK